MKENILIRALLIAQGQTKKQQIKLLQMFKKKKKRPLNSKEKKSEVRHEFEKSQDQG